MSLSSREQQALDSIEGGLAGSDSELVSMLATFAGLASGEEMPVHEEIRVLGRHTTRRPVRNRGPRRDKVHRTRKLCPRLGLQQAIVLLWLTVTIAVVAVALVLSRGSGNRPCPEHHCPFGIIQNLFSRTNRGPLLRQEAPTVEYLVTMTTHVPDGISEEAVSNVRAREAVRSRELAAQGHLLRLWRPPLQPGEWRTLGLFAAGDDGQLEKVLASMRLRVWRTDEVAPLSPHAMTPAPARTCRRSARSS